MSKFEEQKINPVENPREAYKKTEEDETGLKAELAGAKSADEIMEIAMKLKTVEGSKKEMVDIAHEEAIKEKGERKMYDEAKAEDAERTMYDEAKIEDELRSMHDEAKKEDVERTATKESEKLTAELENLRSQIAEKNVDQIMETAAKMKEIEKRIDRLNAAKKEEEIKTQTEKDQKEYENILAKIKGESTEEKITAAKPETIGKTENPINKMRFQYNEVENKIKEEDNRLRELENQRRELNAERKKIEGTGNKEKLSEIQEKLAENEKQKTKIELGEKFNEISEWYREESKKINTYDYVGNSNLKNELQNRSRVQREKWQENGLSGLNHERERLLLEFKKQYGFDEAAEKEMSDKFYGSAGETDVKRIVINNYLGIELPIFSKDFKLAKHQGYSRGEKSFVISDNSMEGISNKTFLAKKQVEIYQKAMEANEAIQKIPMDVRKEIMKEHRFELDALRSPKNAGDSYKPRYIEKSIEEIYWPFAGKEGRADNMFIYPEDRFYPKSEELEKLSGEKDTYNFREDAKANSMVMFNSV